MCIRDRRKGLGYAACGINQHRGRRRGNRRTALYPFAEQIEIDSKAGCRTCRPKFTDQIVIPSARQHRLPRTGRIAAEDDAGIVIGQMCIRDSPIPMKAAAATMKGAAAVTTRGARAITAAANTDLNLPFPPAGICRRVFFCPYEKCPGASPGRANGPYFSR